jgi:hypothetical protein
MADRRLVYHERRALVSKNEGRIQISAKRSTVSLAPSEQFVVDLNAQPALAKAFGAFLSANLSTVTDDQVTQWIVGKGYNTTFDDVINSGFPNVTSSMLLAYTGTYPT